MNPESPTRRPRRSRRRLVMWGVALIVVVTVGVGAVFGSQLGHDPTLVDSPLIGQPAPAVTLPNLGSSGSVSLSELRGGVLVVNFWASWCVACRAEHPALNAAARDYAGAGVVFVGIDYQDQQGSATGFLDEMGRGGSNYRYVTDPGSQAAVDFGVFGVPETFFIDRTGTVVAKITGASTYPLLTRTLDAILAGRAAQSTTAGTVQPAPSG